MYMAYTNNPNLPRVRMEAVELVRQGWSLRKVARHTGFAHNTILNWLQKKPVYGQYGRLVIPTLSSRPNHHPDELSLDIVQKIVEIREKRHRCAEVVHQELLRQDIVVSLSSVKRTLERQGLIKKRSPWKRWHFEKSRPLALNPGDLVQIDTIHIGPAVPGRLYIYTLLDVFSRWAFALVSLRINTHRSLWFVKDALSKSAFKFLTLQSDHGQEFSSWFTEQVDCLEIAHRHSRVKQPNDNGHLERFNRTLQEECLSRIPQSFRSYQKEIPEYLHYYNNERLHIGLNYLTPMQVVRSY
jgi:transposase InsO family protein/lambda repressor-like predicted transcriptional regulator